MFATSLTKTLTAGTLALTLVFTSLTPSTASAQISNDDAVIGIVTLLLLGAAINNNRTDEVDRAPRRQTVRPQRDWRVLPTQCLRQVDRRSGGTVQMFGHHCLNTNYAHVDRLPQACHVAFRADNGQRRQGFLVRCLRNQGFRFNRR